LENLNQERGAHCGPQQNGVDMRRLTVLGIVLIGMAGLCAAPLWAQDGAGTFKSLRCGFCHKPAQKGAGPSLKEIAEAYAGKEDQLVEYLKGGALPVIAPDKASVMQPSLEKTKELSDPDRKALADYILQAK
jgi:cytochrome c